MIFFIFKFFLVDLSIIEAKPTTLPFDLFINLKHSILDLPVVITSSIIKTFDPFLIPKPLRNANFPLTLSQNIVSFFSNFPIFNQGRMHYLFLLLNICSGDGKFS